MVVREMNIGLPKLVQVMKYHGEKYNK